MERYEHIRQELIKRQKELRERLKHYHVHSQSFSTGELSEYDNHPADNATDLYEREKDLSLLENMRKELEDVTEALNKFEKGTYGICEATGKRIPLERLEAYPTAKTVVEFANDHVDDHRPVEEEVMKPGFFGREIDGEETAFDKVVEFNEMDQKEKVFTGERFK